jgi:protein-S-isoprenylcysteine O-methyltransferase Ste14
MGRVGLRLIVDTLLVGALLFLGAGTLAWFQAWVLLAALFTVRVIGAFAVHEAHPALMRERAKLPGHAEQPLSDRILVLAVLATGFLGLPLIAALDVFRWHLLPQPPSPVAMAGLMMFAGGWALKSLALRANAFAVTVVRLQAERDHAVVDSGPYAVVRHPFYAADPLILVGLSLWLRSSFATLCAVIPIALMIVRLMLEERFLRRNLPGYDAYERRVRFRLIPGIW